MTASPDMTGPPAVDGIGPAEDWQGYWRNVEAGKRQSANWINGR